MLSYLRCIKSHRGSNDPECRNLSKSYLSCRMDRYVPTLFRHMLSASARILSAWPHQSRLPVKQGSSGR
jgi:hypothetical protein